MKRIVDPNRWDSKHRKKIVHRTWIGAAWHAFRLALKDLRRMTFRREEICFPYECRWGESYRDGETAPVHWHVGRRRKQS